MRHLVGPRALIKQGGSNMMTRMTKIEAVSGTGMELASENESQSSDRDGGRYITVWIPNEM